MVPKDPQQMICMYILYICCAVYVMLAGRQICDTLRCVARNTGRTICMPLKSSLLCDLLNIHMYPRVTLLFVRDTELFVWYLHTTSLIDWKLNPIMNYIILYNCQALVRQLSFSC